MKRFLKELIPQDVQAYIRQMKWWDKLTAIRLARSSKRLDLCAAQMAHLFHLSKISSVKGKVCVEVGSGWVLSHAVVLHLLGAAKVITTDIAPMAHPSLLRKAIRSSELYIVRDILSPFCEHSEIRNRLNNLLALEDFTFEALKQIGIEYKAPVDLSRTPLGIPFDLAYSLSVLEHVSYEKVPALLNNLSDDLREGGFMIHAIHMEDHNNFLDRPFDFLSIPQQEFSQSVQGKRENRIRASLWHEIFKNVRSLDSQFIYQWTRRDKKLPEVIDPSILHVDEEDLRISHIGVLSFKK